MTLSSDLQKKIQIVIIGIILVFILKFFSQYSEDIRIIIQNVNFYHIFILIGLLCLCQLWSAILWALLIRDLGCPLKIIHLIAVWQFSLAGIFIPGSFWDKVGRIYQLSKAHVPKRISAYSVSFEVIILLSSAFVVSCLTPGIFKTLKLPPQAGFLFLPLVLIVFFPNTLVKLLKRFPGLKINLSLDNEPHKWILLIIFAGYLFFHFSIGFCTLQIIKTFGIATAGLTFLNLTGYTAVSLIIGYLAIFAPNGLGVREGILAFLLTQHFPLPKAVLVAFGLRFFSLVAALISIFLGFLYLKIITVPKTQKNQDGL